MKLSKGLPVLFSLLFFYHLHAQNAVALNDLSFFQSPGPSWKLAKEVKADLDQQSYLSFTPGTGILVNISDEKKRGQDLYSVARFGDMDLELDYMMATGSNSGIYLQGRYEVQLLDSWGVTRPTSGDNGGIYERWYDNKPPGQQGYDGHAPRQNVSRAPGLWQHIKISFQAPRFNDNGIETRHARIIKVELNGVTIQEDVELAGPTRGPMENNEVALGPLRLQGDHGAVAFRNIVITPYDSQGAGMRKNIVSEVSEDPVDPILINASENMVLRSFVNIDTVKLTHTVNVGSPLQVNYTYDMNKGTIVQLWHGGFLDATEMFTGRGEGLSRPVGMVLQFGVPQLTLEKLSSSDALWFSDTAGTNYRPKGYVLDDNDRPTFRYLIYNTQVSDKSVVLPGGHGVHREISILQPVQNLYVRIASATDIEKISEGLYLAGNKSYYIKFGDSTGLKPIIRSSNGHQELIAPIQEKISYSILF